MKVKELIEQLKGKEEFELSVCFDDEELNSYVKCKWGLLLRNLKITGIGDIGYSENVVVLDAEIID